MYKLIIYVLFIFSIGVIGYQIHIINSLKSDIKTLNYRIVEINEMHNKRIENEIKTKDALLYLNQCKIEGYKNETDIFNNINNRLFNNK